MVPAQITKGESFTFLNNNSSSILVDHPAEQSILSTKEAQFKNDFRVIKHAGALSNRNKGGCLDQLSVAQRKNQFSKTHVDIFPQGARTARYTQHDDRKQDDSLFITTYRAKSRSSVREHHPPDNNSASKTTNLATTEKQKSRHRPSQTKSFVQQQSSRSQAFLPLPPKVKLRLVPTVRLFGDQQQLLCSTKQGDDTQENSNIIKTSQSLDQGHFLFQRMNDTCQHNDSDLPDQVRGQQNTDKNNDNKRNLSSAFEEQGFTCQAESSIGSSPQPRATLTSVLSAKMHQHLQKLKKGNQHRSSGRDKQQNFRSQTSIQDEAKPFASTLFNPDDDAFSEETVKERFSEMSDEDQKSFTSSCHNQDCQELKLKMEEKDHMITSLQDEIRVLQRTNQEQRRQIAAVAYKSVDSKEEMTGKDKGVKLDLQIDTTADLMTTVDQKANIQAIVAKETPKARILDQSFQQSFHQSAKTLLRKMKEASSIYHTTQDAQQDPHMQMQLYDQLSTLLEQCLIVDDFNKDLDQSLESYMQKGDLQQSQQCISEAEDDDVMDGSVKDVVSNQKISLVKKQSHKRQETLSRQDFDQKLADREAMNPEYDSNTVSFAQTKAFYANKCALLKEGSSGETTARNLRYVQKEQSSQSISLSQHIITTDNQSKQSKKSTQSKQRMLNDCQKKESVQDDNSCSSSQNSSFLMISSMVERHSIEKKEGQ